MSIILSDSEGTTDVLSDIAEFTYNVAMYPLENKFTAVIKKPSYSVVYKTARVSFQGSLLFQGNVIKQSVYLGHDGYFLDLVCAGYEMKMAENQVRPRSMENCSSTTVYNNYAYSYGVVSNGLESATIPNLTITAGMSAWNAVDMFCRQAYNYLPLITREGKLTVDYLSGNSYTIGNNGTKHPYTKLKYTDDRSKMLSRIYRKDIDGDSYPTYHDFQIALDYGITRERYYTMPTAWEPYPDTAVSQLLRNAALDSLLVEVTLPELLPAYPADTITFSDSFFSEKKYYVSSVAMVCNSNGYYTNLKLWSMMRN